MYKVGDDLEAICYGGAAVSSNDGRLSITANPRKQKLLRQDATTMTPGNNASQRKLKHPSQTRMTSPKLTGLLSPSRLNNALIPYASQSAEFIQPEVLERNSLRMARREAHQAAKRLSRSPKNKSPRKSQISTIKRDPASVESPDAQPRKLTRTEASDQLKELAKEYQNFAKKFQDLEASMHTLDLD